MYEIAPDASLASILESLRNALHFNGPYYLDKWTNSKSESKSREHVSECVLEFQVKGENNIPWDSISSYNSYHSSITMTLVEALASKEHETCCARVAYMTH